MAIAAGAHLAVELPGAEAPQTAQTLAVLLVGAALGPLGGALAVGLYLALGALGFPVFADGASGVEVLVGPTAGYLVGFAVAAVWVGAWVREPARRRLPMACLGMVIAHALLLALGWARLTLVIGAARAFHGGVAPFVVGGLAKSFLAAAVVSGLAALAAGRRSEGLR